jgi:hypothetical protein
VADQVIQRARLGIRGQPGVLDAALSAMHRAPHEGQNPRFLQLNATSFSAWHCSQRTRMDPCSSRPHFR